MERRFLPESVDVSRNDEKPPPGVQFKPPSIAVAESNGFKIGKAAGESWYDVVDGDVDRECGVLEVERVGDDVEWLR